VCGVHVQAAKLGAWSYDFLGIKRQAQIHVLQYNSFHTTKILSSSTFIGKFTWHPSANFSINLQCLAQGPKRAPTYTGLEASIRFTLATSTTIGMRSSASLVTVAIRRCG